MQQTLSVQELDFHVQQFVQSGSRLIEEQLLNALGTNSLPTDTQLRTLLFVLGNTQQLTTRQFVQAAFKRQIELHLTAFTRSRLEALAEEVLALLHFSSDASYHHQQSTLSPQQAIVTSTKKDFATIAHLFAHLCWLLASLHHSFRILQEQVPALLRQATGTNIAPSAHTLDAHMLLIAEILSELQKLNTNSSAIKNRPRVQQQYFKQNILPIYLSLACDYFVACFTLLQRVNSGELQATADNQLVEQQYRKSAVQSLAVIQACVSYDYAYAKDASGEQQRVTTLQATSGAQIPDIINLARHFEGKNPFLAVLIQFDQEGTPFYQAIIAILGDQNCTCELWGAVISLLSHVLQALLLTLQHGGAQAENIFVMHCQSYIRTVLLSAANITNNSQNSKQSLSLAQFIANSILPVCATPAGYLQEWVLFVLNFTRQLLAVEKSNNGNDQGVNLLENQTDDDDDDDDSKDASIRHCLRFLSFHAYVLHASAPYQEALWQIAQLYIVRMARKFQQAVQESCSDNQQQQISEYLPSEQDFAILDEHCGYLSHLCFFFYAQEASKLENEAIRLLSELNTVSAADSQAMIVCILHILSTLVFARLNLSIRAYEDVRRAKAAEAAANQKNKNNQQGEGNEVSLHLQLQVQRQCTRESLAFIGERLAVVTHLVLSANQKYIAAAGGCLKTDKNPFALFTMFRARFYCKFARALFGFQHSVAFFADTDMANVLNTFMRTLHPDMAAVQNDYGAVLEELFNYAAEIINKVLDQPQQNNNQLTIFLIMHVQKLLKTLTDGLSYDSQQQRFSIRKIPFREELCAPLLHNHTASLYRAGGVLSTKTRKIVFEAVASLCMCIFEKRRGEGLRSFLAPYDDEVLCPLAEQQRTTNAHSGNTLLLGKNDEIILYLTVLSDMRQLIAHSDTSFLHLVYTLLGSPERGNFFELLICVFKSTLLSQEQVQQVQQQQSSAYTSGHNYLPFKIQIATLKLMVEIFDTRMSKRGRIPDSGTIGEAVAQRIFFSRLLRDFGSVFALFIAQRFWNCQASVITNASNGDKSDTLSEQKCKVFGLLAKFYECGLERSFLEAGKIGTEGAFEKDVARLALQMLRLIAQEEFIAYNKQVDALFQLLAKLVRENFRALRTTGDLLLADDLLRLISFAAKKLAVQSVWSNMQSVHFLNHLLYFGIVSREGFPCRAEMALIFDAAREDLQMLCTLLLNEITRIATDSQGFPNKNDRLLVSKLFTSLSLLNSEFATQLMQNSFAAEAITPENVAVKLLCAICTAYETTQANLQEKEEKTIVKEYEACSAEVYKIFEKNTVNNV